MIDFAMNNAIQSGVAERIQFDTIDFESYEAPLKQRFDWVIALTVFEYSLDPEQWLVDIAPVTKQVKAYAA